MIQDELKNCKVCCMAIPAKARKCPHCHHWQDKWSLVIFHPLFAIIPTLMIFLVMFGFLGTMFKFTFAEGEPFSKHQNAVALVETEMLFGEVSGCKTPSPTVAVIGKIRNSSPVTWKEITLEGQFFDKDGRMVDATQQLKYSFIAPANGDCAFKISFQREFPQERYSSFKVRVVSAKDERKRF